MDESEKFRSDKGHTILRTLSADNIHKEGFCGQYGTKRDFADAVDLEQYLR